MTALSMPTLSITDQEDNTLKDDWMINAHMSITDQEDNTLKDDRMINAHIEYYWPGG